MSEKSEKVVKKSESTKALPVCPPIYEDGAINMHSSMITTKSEFIKLFKGSKAARGTDLEKAFEKASKWRKKFK